jgi:hypothetical protein
MSLTNAAEIDFKRGKFGIRQVRPGNHDNVPAGPLLLVQPEYLSNQTFGLVSPNRAADASRCHDPQSIVDKAIRQEQHRHETA